MAEIDPLIVKLDELISLSRLNELAVLLGTDRPTRLVRMATALAKLPRGAYLLGTGPSTVGVIRLSVEEVVLGRAATPAEEPTETVTDYWVNDTLHFAPHEVSRAHAKIVRRGDQFSVVDLGSTCGTFVNGQRVESQGEGQPLSHGDVLSLGPSQVSTYVFWVTRSP
jgi:pSer/pThr/pTyr-binding forkhead associated (FHA) protein